MPRCLNTGAGRKPEALPACLRHAVNLAVPTVQPLSPDASHHRHLLFLTETVRNSTPLNGGYCPSLWTRAEARTRRKFDTYIHRLPPASATDEATQREAPYARHDRDRASDRDRARNGAAAGTRGGARSRPAGSGGLPPTRKGERHRPTVGREERAAVRRWSR